MISQTILNQMIEKHQLWLETEGQEGEQFNLKNEKIIELDFQEGNLAKAFILGCDIQESCLNKVNFEKATIGFTAIIKCKMEGINFQEAILSSARFVNNEMNNSSFYGSQNFGGVFYKNNLQSSNFKSDEPNEEGIPVILTTINHCVLDENTFDLSNFENTLLQAYNFVKFKNNSFQNCNLNNCNFEGNNLFECNLSGSSVVNTIFNECNFIKTKIEALNIDSASLINCLGNNKEITTIQAHLFICVIAGTKMYIDVLSKTKNEWINLPEEEVVQELMAISNYTQEELASWWIIWKPIFAIIINN